MSKSKSKIRKLIAGKRPFSKRILLAFLPSLALSFTILFFGPLDLVYISQNYVAYSPLKILPIMAGVMCGAFLLLLLPASVIGGSIHAFLVSLYTGIALASYLQGALLNPNFGTLDGHTVNWVDFSGLMARNLLIWVLIILVPFFIHFLSNNAWRKSVMLVSAALILMQSVSLTQKMIEQYKIDAEKESTCYFSNENMLKLGKKNNVVVFLLDSVTNNELRKAEELYPGTYGEFKDFTVFDNANSRWIYTVPSVLDMLTAYDPEITAWNYQEHLDAAWKNPIARSFYTELKNNQFETNLYVLQKEVVNDPCDIRNLVSNVVEMGADMKINKATLVNLIKLSLYRYSPVIAKPFFMIYTTDVNQIASSEYSMKDQWDFVTEFLENDLTLGNQDNVFSYYYLHGSHSPYIMDENGMIQDKVGVMQQVKGFMNLIEKYIKQMKLLNIYDDSTIVILSDHGKVQRNPQPIFMIKTANEHHDEMVYNHAPITTQVSLLPTIASQLNFSGMNYGETAFDVPEDLVTERWMERYVYYDGFPKGPGKNGWNAIIEYHYTGGQDELLEVINGGGDVRYYPIESSFYSF